jgi:hypothetical protein
MISFMQFLNENSGHFHVSAIVLGSNGPKRVEGTITNRSQDYNREAVLMQFLGRHLADKMTNKELRAWFLKYKDICNVRWVPGKAAEPGQKELGIDSSGERKPLFINFPSRY